VNLYYLNRKWLAVYGYLLVVLIVTPWLPLFIKWASSEWPKASIAGFVLDVEISLGVLLIISAGAVFFLNASKFRSFVFLIGGFITFAWVFYAIIPNPYELTHLPQYAILGVLLQHALKGGDAEQSEKESGRSLYFRSALITGVVGTIDELYQGVLPLRYFAWYDVFLNEVGGLLGLTVLWGISRE
jgi:hypothetical protein